MRPQGQRASALSGAATCPQRALSAHFCRKLEVPTPVGGRLADCLLVARALCAALFQVQVKLVERDPLYQARLWRVSGRRRADQVFAPDWLNSMQGCFANTGVATKWLGA